MALTFLLTHNARPVGLPTPPFPSTPLFYILYGPAPGSLSPLIPILPASPLGIGISFLFVPKSVVFCTLPLATYLEKAVHCDGKLRKSRGWSRTPGYPTHSVRPQRRWSINTCGNENMITTSSLTETFKTTSSKNHLYFSLLC